MLLLFACVKIMSARPAWVEQHYSLGFYPSFARVLRFTWGWVPFSVGDLLYAFFIIFLLVKLVGMVRAILRKKTGAMYWLGRLRKLVFLLLCVYVIFYFFWGLNYSRQGIASQLKLTQQVYTVGDLDSLIVTLQSRLNYYADRIDTTKRDSSLRRGLLFKKAALAYGEAEKKFPFLHYRGRSIKVSMYSPIAHLMGFSGYYNPFSGEAQLQVEYPAFLLPFVVTHEIGHQLGYAKEDEASFSGFIACRSYDDVDFRYSMYFDLYLSASFEMIFHDPRRYKQLRDSLHPRVKEDYRQLMEYLRRKQNLLEPYISKFYDSYLKANNQPLGKKTYDQVTYWLIGYGRRFGWKEL
jgi:hypothetical protein